MGRSPCCEKVGLKKGPWTPEEDQKLLAYIEENGHGSWRALPSKAGLQRCGKSCRLRWTNYLRPDIKRGKFSLQEEQTIIQLHALLGNRWSAIATHLPKRTDNEIKNYWNTHLKKRLSKMGIDPVTHKPKNDTLSGLANTQSGSGGSGSVVNNKSAANLSHMAQWESARLEAEARLVRQSKLLSLHSFSASTSASMMIKAEPPPPSVRHHNEHEWTEQLAISCCSSMEGGGGGGGPWSPDNENDINNDHHHEESSYDKDNNNNNNNCTSQAHDNDDSVGEEGFINLLLSADDHDEEEGNNDENTHNDENAAAAEEVKQQEYSTTSTTDNNSGGRSSTNGENECCYEEEEDINNKNYWNTILNLVDTSSPSPVDDDDHHHPIF